jgi:hypothetical protein
MTTSIEWVPFPNRPWTLWVEGETGSVGRYETLEQALSIQQDRRKLLAAIRRHRARRVRR